MKLGFKSLLLTTAFTASVAPVAMAQDDNPFLRGRYTEVTARQQQEFDPEPIIAGAFSISSSLGVGAEYNDNIFAEPNNEDDDTIIRLTPNVEARSNWSVHELVAGLSLDHREYASNDSETSTDYSAFVNGRIDVTRDFMFRLGANTAHVTEPRYAAASFGAAEAAEFDNTGLFASAIYRRDRFQVEGTVGMSSDEFDQAVQQFRDNDTTYVNARFSYAFSPDVAVFVQARQSELDYSGPGANRDGTQTLIDAGVNFELAAPLRGEIAVGQFTDDKDNPAFGDTEGLNIRANVKWFPTQLTTVTFSGNRGVTDPGLATSASSVYTAFGVRVDHELFRNVLLFGDLRTDNYDFQGSAIDREDDALNAAFGAQYKLNKNMRLEASYSMRSQDSSGANAGPNLDQNILSASIRFFP
jgi:hypothetical protein